jgi:FimV-like protein
MGDNEMARSLLTEVLQQGSDSQKKEAQTLLGRLA